MGVMKNLLTTIVLIIAIISTNNLLANTNPANSGGEEVVLVNSNSVTYSIAQITDAVAFNSVSYNGITKMLTIDTKENMAFVEILNIKGELEFLMPVGSKLLNLDMLDFEKGSYTINIKIQEADNKIISSKLVKSF